MRDILVIGSLNMDMVIRTPRIPAAGETLLGCFQAYVPGGKGANQACAAGRLGKSAAMLGMVGRDAFGETLVANLRGAGVDTALVGACGERTGQAVIYVSDAGENSIVVLPGANNACDGAHMRAMEREIAASRAVMLQMEIPHQAVYEAIRIAARHGRTVILDPAPAVSDLAQDVFAHIDYLTPNETELAVLTGMPVTCMEEAVAAARSLRGRGVRNVLATLGARGVLHIGGAGERVYPARRVAAVDTTAAGDTFNAAFAVRITEGAPIEEAVAFANAAAAICVTRNGAQPSIPTRVEVDALLKGEKTA